MSDTLTSTMKEMGLISNETADRVSFAFDCMEISETEIYRAQKKHPSAHDALYKSFGKLCPPEGMWKFGKELYRAYVREQLERIAEDKPINVPTDAEILMCFSEMMLKAPLTPDATKLCFDIFARAFPDHPILKDVDPMYESSKGACFLMEIDIRKHLGKIERSGS
jgi:hypothetical protein